MKGGPPAWFEKYVQGVKSTENMASTSKKGVRSIKKDAKDTAAEKWKDGMTRDKVHHEIDGHMSRMYQMMFK